MTVWAWLGWRQVEQRCRPHMSAQTRMYVDDRTFTTARAWCLQERFQHWQAWSTAVGLQENARKAAAVASTPARRAILRRALPEQTRHDVELLGCCMRDKLADGSWCVRVDKIRFAVGMDEPTRTHHRATGAYRGVCPSREESFPSRSTMSNSLGHQPRVALSQVILGDPNI